jgi:hypothetical protein
VNHATTGVAGRIYGYFVPATGNYPCALYSFQGGRDVSAVGAIRVMGSMLYQVKIVGKSTRPDFGSIKALADRVDTLLQAASGTTTDGRVLSCVREAPISYVETHGSDCYSHAGGLYRLQVQPK